MDESILAIYSFEIKSFLIKFNLLEQIQKGELSCFVCEEKITLDNIGCIYPIKKEIKFCCDKLVCIQKMLDLVIPLRSTTEEVFDE